MEKLTDVDGKADLAVWRNASGNWYLCSSRVEFDCSRGAAVQWGLPGDIPVVGRHLDGNAFTLNVFRPASGIWFGRGVELGGSTAFQWELPGDIPLGKAVNTNQPQ